MNVLAIGAHPDDLEYGCAGALIRHVHRGDRVYLAVVTDGSQGGDPKMRRQEQLDAAKIIGAEEVFFLDFPDTLFECNRESITRIEEVVRKVDAEIVYSHFGEDTHQDHRNVARAVVPAARSVPNLLYFEGLSAQNFMPNVFVNTGRMINQKLAALEAHASQVEKTNIENMTILDISRSAANFRGIQGRVTYAEGFVAVRYFIDL
ncbi:MAG: PIG-L family deacetylase [Gemmatimonadetes bacterium]|jgi:LmbE family N-acetylglucosaminyl deacetylase|nr:PIG-L family deacetylase [Gemmatimonadota bacterium]